MRPGAGCGPRGTGGRGASGGCGAPPRRAPAAARPSAVPFWAGGAEGGGAGRWDDARGEMRPARGRGGVWGGRRRWRPPPADRACRSTPARGPVAGRRGRGGGEGSGRGVGSRTGAGCSLGGAGWGSRNCAVPRAPARAPPPRAPAISARPSAAPVLTSGGCACLGNAVTGGALAGVLAPKEACGAVARETRLPGQLLCADG